MGKLKLWKSISAGICIPALILCSACGSSETEALGNTDTAQDTSAGDVISAAGIPEEDAQDGIVLHSDFLTQAGIVEQTWEKDYDSSEWADKPCINILASGMVESSNHKISEVEEECNHYLDENGYDFQVHFVLSEMAEMFNGITAEEELARREVEGIAIDMYLPADYHSAVQQGELLELNDYLAGEEGRRVYEYYDEMLWEFLREDGDSIYGIPRNPIAVQRRVYAYNPQLTELLEIDMSGFEGDLQTLEPYFQDILEQNIAPVCLNDIRQDKLLLSEFGLENYENMIAISHEGETPKAVDLWEEPEALQFYIYLGSLREKGYLVYSDALLGEMDLTDTAAGERMSRKDYRYIFLSIGYKDQSSFAYDVNTCEDGFVETEYAVPEQAAYFYGDISGSVLTVRKSTAYPEECLTFAKLLVTDDQLKRILYCGIENYHYMWQNDRLIYSPEGSAFAFGLGLEYDRSFLSEEYHERFTQQYRKMNTDVRYAAAYEKQIDLSGLEQEYAECRKIFEDNQLLFWGYYGEETECRLDELHEELMAAGYDRLIAAVNASLYEPEE